MYTYYFDKYTSSFIVVRVPPFCFLLYMLPNTPYYAIWFVFETLFYKFIYGKLAYFAHTLQYTATLDKIQSHGLSHKIFSRTIKNWLPTKVVKSLLCKTKFHKSVLILSCIDLERRASQTFVYKLRKFMDINDCVLVTFVYLSIQKIN